MARAPTQKELAAFVVGHGITDFVTGGKLSLIERNAIWKVLKKLGTTTARAAPRAAGTAVAVGRTIAMRHPYIAGGTLLYVAATNREQIADLIRQGYDVVEQLPGQERREEFARDPVGFIQDVRESMPPGYGPGGLFRPITGVQLPKRKSKRRSAYNSGVSKGLKALKKSTSYGTRGVLRTPRKAFGFVARTVSKLLKGKKVPSKGASGVVKRSLNIKVRKP